MGVTVRIKNIRGEYKPLNLFSFFDDGIRKRLPKLLAQELYDQVIRNIETNKFNFHLSRAWENYKKRVGADTRPFIMFQYYKKAITIMTDNGHLTVGFKSTTMHPRAKMSMGKLAVKLEYGDLATGAPARPLWRRTTETFFRERKSRIDKAIKDSLK